MSTTINAVTMMLATIQRRMAWQWWWQLSVLLLVLLGLGRFTLAAPLAQEPRGLIFFALSLLSLFASRRPFHQFKQSVIRLGQNPQRLQSLEAWQDYQRARGRALWVASVPAYCGAIGALLGLESLAAALLLLCSLLLFWLYRTPRQLWFVSASA